MKARLGLLAAVGGVACSMVAGVHAASAQSATDTRPMAPNYTIEARVWKDFGNPNPTHWSTSTWTFHGAALQSMSRIKDSTRITSSSPLTSASCSVGVDTGNPSGNCSLTPVTNTSDVTYTWENGNTYISDLNGTVYNNFWLGIGWIKVCNAGSAYSSRLGIKGNALACVG
jgi:hypothetical protein